MQHVLELQGLVISVQLLGMVVCPRRSGSLVAGSSSWLGCAHASQAA
jgi:hypothetical protein